MRMSGCSHRLTLCLRSSLTRSILSRRIGRRSRGGRDVLRYSLADWRGDEIVRPFAADYRPEQPGAARDAACLPDASR